MSRSLRELFERAQQRLSAGEFDAQDLQLLQEATLQQRRQRLLYIYALQPTVRALVVATTLHEVSGSLCQIDPQAPELPYQCVMDAIADGWRVIHFPDHRGPYREGRMDMLGYEFVLEKLEADVA
ncbi:hypothetical protein IV102_14165 [bacterium]|nr:hypothetical protein [bacterium]